MMQSESAEKRSEAGGAARRVRVAMQTEDWPDDFCEVSLKTATDSILVEARFVSANENSLHRPDSRHQLVCWVRQTRRVNALQFDEKFAGVVSGLQLGSAVLTRVSHAQVPVQQPACNVGEFLFVNADCTPRHLPTCAHSSQ
jgi:hypothetical protein